MPDAAAGERERLHAALAKVNTRPSVEPFGEVRYGQGPYATWTRAFLERMGRSPRKAKGSFAVSDVETIVSQVLVLVAKGSGPLGTGQAQEIVKITGLSPGLTVTFLVDLTATNRASGALFERLKDLAATAGAMEAAGMLSDVPPLIAVLNGMGQTVARATREGQVERLRALDAVLTGIEHNMRAGAAPPEPDPRDEADAVTPGEGLVFDAEEPVPARVPEPVAPPVPPPPAKPVTGLDKVLQELSALVGSEAVKQETSLLVDKARLMATRKEVGLNPYKVARHFAFLGNPGTAKSTVASLLSRVYGELGLLTKGHLVEIEAADLVDRATPDGTPARTRAAMEPARGGILFVRDAWKLDEADLAPFAGEAIGTLARVMRDSRCDIVIVLAGPPAPMQAFLDARPELSAHVPTSIAFPDYSTRDMLAILVGLAREARCAFEPAAKPRLLEVAERLCSNPGEGFGNARLAERLLGAIVESRALRASRAPGQRRGQGLTATAEDVLAAEGIVRSGIANAASR